MSLKSPGPRRVAAALAVASAAATAGVVAAAPAQAAACTDAHVVFARGSGEFPGLGIAGTPLVNSIRQNLPGKTVSSYAVNYAASLSQTSAGPGATDMTKHVVSYAQQCPNAKFVLGGYSQGASVTDIAIGLPVFLGSGQKIPTNLAPRVAAIVVFGNPAKITGQTIVRGSQLYGSKAKEFCNAGDPVCGAGFNFMAHMTYAFDGSAAKGGQFAAEKIKAGG